MSKKLPAPAPTTSGTLSLQAFAEHNGLQLHDLARLQEAVTHRSYRNEHPDAADNERLEFLGDAILDAITSDQVFHQFPDAPEGELTRLRSLVVRRESLAAFARLCRLPEVFRVGRGDLRNGGLQNDTNLEGAFEAVIGAIYLENGMDAARAFALPHITRRLAELAAGDAPELDPRSTLQTWSQGKSGITPRYEHRETGGTPTQRIFTADVWIGERRLGTGTGYSKHEAATRAAEAALVSIEQAEVPRRVANDSSYDEEQ